MEKLINEIVTDIRKQHKLSRKGIENLTGFKERTIGSYERGEREVSKEYIEFLSLFFGYTVEYIRGTGAKLLDKFIQTIKIYQSIYNYSNDKMAKLLNISIEDYENTFNLNDDNYLRDYYIDRKTNFVLEVLEKLNIKPSSIKLSLYKMKKRNFYIDKKIENLEERYNTLELKGIEITPEYYASVIKKRNQPKGEYTPKDDLKEIPPKHKEILDLLSYAPDSFLDTIIQKLKTLKETQQL
jgi:transcriptional regulator with XRE-family HTH domain